MRPILAVAWLAAVLAFIGCPSPGPSPQPPPAPDASDSGPPPASCTAACTTLKAVGCPEGSASDCATVLGHIDEDRTVRTPAGPALTCAAVAAIRTAADAHKLGIACD